MAEKTMYVNMRPSGFGPPFIVGEYLTAETAIEDGLTDPDIPGHMMAVPVTYKVPDEPEAEAEAEAEAEPARPLPGQAFVRQPGQFDPSKRTFIVRHVDDEYAYGCEFVVHACYWAEALLSADHGWELLEEGQ